LTLQSLYCDFGKLPEYVLAKGILKQMGHNTGHENIYSDFAQNYHLGISLEWIEKRSLSEMESLTYEKKLKENFYRQMNYESLHPMISNATTDRVREFISV